MSMKVDKRDGRDLKPATGLDLWTGDTLSGDSQEFSACPKLSIDAFVVGDAKKRERLVPYLRDMNTVYCHEVQRGLLPSVSEADLLRIIADTAFGIVGEGPSPFERGVNLALGILIGEREVQAFPPILILLGIAVMAACGGDDMLPGDALQPKDIDGDGILNKDDNCRIVPNRDQRDIDKDGVGDVCDDSNENGIVDAKDGFGDIDGDGIRNSHDWDDLDGPLADADGDGIRNDDEWRIGTNFRKKDSDDDGRDDKEEVGPDVKHPKNTTDGDRWIDAVDTDDDNDGILSEIENYFKTDPYYSDSDDDGVVDAQEYGQNVNDPRDTDKDGIIDALDDDDDGDGKKTWDEGYGDIDMDGILNYLDKDDTDGLNYDPDGDGLDNWLEAQLRTNPYNPDTDGDTLWDRSELGNNPWRVQDTDNDGLINARDPDDDGDGIPTKNELALGTKYLLDDSDADGLKDGVEVEIQGDAFVLKDTDGDGIKDVFDTDDDDDGILTKYELMTSVKTNPLKFDSDDDGIGDKEEVGTNFAQPRDTDGDDIIDANDPDDDNDGKPTIDEGEGDDDGDRIPNYRDANDNDGPLGDLDGDGLKNGRDNCPAISNSNQKNLDHDDLGDVCDPDIDGDGILNTVDNCPTVVDPDPNPETDECHIRTCGATEWETVDKPDPNPELETLCNHRICDAENGWIDINVVDTGPPAPACQERKCTDSVGWHNQNNDALSCSDEKDYTTDRCNNGSCVSELNPCPPPGVCYTQTTRQPDGSCTYPDKSDPNPNSVSVCQKRTCTTPEGWHNVNDDTLTCTDGRDYTTDVCSSGQCVSTLNPCPPPPDACHTAAMRQGDGSCTYPNKADPAPTAPVCQERKCTDSVGWHNQNNDALSCSDEKDYTTDVCDNGSCVSTLNPCPPPDVCHTQTTRQIDGSCTYPDKSDPNPNSVSVCQKRTCTTPEGWHNVNDDTLTCADERDYTTDVCSSGQCVSELNPCPPPPDACHTAAMRQDDGSCPYPDKPDPSPAAPDCQVRICFDTLGWINENDDTLSCNDNNICTQTDSCQSGVCAGSDPVQCVASDQCHDAGTCAPESGICSNPVKPGQNDIDGDGMFDACDTDADNDTHLAVSAGGDDCDDLNASAYPDFIGEPADGIDHDCNGYATAWINAYEMPGNSAINAVVANCVGDDACWGGYTFVAAQNGQPSQNYNAAYGRVSVTGAISVDQTLNSPLNLREMINAMTSDGGILHMLGQWAGPNLDLWEAQVNVGTPLPPPAYARSFDGGSQGSDSGNDFFVMDDGARIAIGDTSTTSGRQDIWITRLAGGASTTLLQRDFAGRNDKGMALARVPGNDHFFALGGLADATDQKHLWIAKIYFNGRVQEKIYPSHIVFDQGRRIAIGPDGNLNVLAEERVAGRGVDSLLLTINPENLDVISQSVLKASAGDDWGSAILMDGARRVVAGSYWTEAEGNNAFVSVVEPSEDIVFERSYTGAGRNTDKFTSLAMSAASGKIFVGGASGIDSTKSAMLVGMIVKR